MSGARKKEERLYIVEIDYKASNVRSSAPAKVLYDRKASAKQKVRSAMAQGVRSQDIRVRSLKPAWQDDPEFGATVCLACATPWTLPNEQCPQMVAMRKHNVRFAQWPSAQHPLPHPEERIIQGS